MTSDPRFPHIQHLLARKKLMSKLSRGSEFVQFATLYPGGYAMHYHYIPTSEFDGTVGDEAIAKTMIALFRADPIVQQMQILVDVVEGLEDRFDELDPSVDEAKATRAVIERLEQMLEAMVPKVEG